jgi:large subunit ribosomal protein L23
MATKTTKKQEARKEVFGILKSPCITEKSSRLENDNFYVFKVEKNSNKKLIKEAIESQYKVEVEKVMIVNIPPKKKFEGRKIAGFKSGYKKAIVKIKEGQKIELTGK